MTKRIISFILAAALTLVHSAALFAIPAFAAPVKETQYFGIRDADYFLYDGRAWLENLIFEKDEELAAMASDNPDRVYFDELPDISNDFFEKHTTAYCMESDAAYPWGCTYVSDTYLSESYYTSGQTALINNILYNGYPANKAYWAEHGVKSYGAQMMATQAAIWIITGGFATTPYQNGYDLNLFEPNFDKYSTDEIGGLKDMLSELIECGRDSMRKVLLPKVELKADKVSNIFDTYEYEFSLNIDTGDTAFLSVDGFGGECQLYLNGTQYDYSPGMPVPKDTVSITVKAPAKNYINHTVSLTVYTTANTVSADKLYLNMNSDMVEKWQGSGLFPRQQIISSYFETVQLSAFAEQTSYYEEKRCVIHLEKSGESLVDYDSDKGFIYRETGLSGAVYGIYRDSLCKDLIEKLVTDDNGRADSASDLIPGKYYIKEIKAPSGYITDCKVYEAEFEEGYTSLDKKEYTLFLSDRRQKVSLMLHKTDENGNPLKNATFELYNQCDILNDKGDIIVPSGTLLEKAVTDESGRINFQSDLPLGYTYKALESAVPYGYLALDKDYVLFETSEGIAENVSDYEVIYITGSLVNTRQWCRLCVYKTGEVLTDYDNEFIYDVRPIKGVVFELYGDSSATQLLETMITDDNGTAFSSCYEEGTYYIKEISAPGGLIADETLHKVELFYDSTEVVSTANVSLNNERRKPRYKAHKTGSDGNIPLAGAEFEVICDNDIYDFTGERLLVHKGETVETVFSDENGMITLKKDYPWQAELSLSEVKSPYGYAMTANKYSLENDEDISITNEPVVGNIRLDFDSTPAFSGSSINVPDTGKKVSYAPQTGDADDMYTWILALILSSYFIICLTILFRPSKSAKTVQRKVSTAVKNMLTIFMTVFSLFFLFYVKDVKADEIHIESPVLYPDETYEFDAFMENDRGKYILSDVTSIITPITDRYEYISYDYVYEGYPDGSTFPQSITKKVTDEITGESREYSFSVESMELLKTYWIDDLEFFITCYNVDGKYFLYNGVKYLYEDNTPDMTALSAQIMADLKLDSENFEITSYEWDGDAYEENGVLTRRIRVRGRRKLSDFKVTYADKIRFDDIENARIERAVYVLQEETSQDTISQEIISSQSQPTEKTPDVAADTSYEVSEKDATGLYKAAVLILAVCLIFALIFGRRKTRKRNY